jgi:hypothetical protein
VRTELGKGKLDGSRLPVNKSGTISFGSQKVDCLVLNLSANGAGLTLTSEAVLPLAFDLEISDEKIRRRCLVVWRIERRLGVWFCNV